MVISGVGPALGTTLARRCAEAGADLVLAARTVERLDDVAKQITDLGRRAVSVGTDITDDAQVDNLVAETLKAYGKVDVLINNAGMSPHYDRPVDISEALYDKVLEVNLKGAFRACANVGQRMLEAGGGAIINISSAAAIRPRKDIITYAAAKAGLNAMTEAFADAYGPSVRVNAIMPGPFLTDISKAWDMAAFAERARTSIALGRGGQAEEIVGAALYLASDQASYTTAAILKIDGGSL